MERCRHHHSSSASAESGQRRKHYGPFLLPLSHPAHPSLAEPKEKLDGKRSGCALLEYKVKKKGNENGFGGKEEGANEE